jgi:hypothetical protein
MEHTDGMSSSLLIHGRIIRVPTAGRLASCCVQELYPDGLTNADINAMTREAYFRDIEPRVQRVGTLISQPQEVQFETREMRVNDFKPLAFYCLVADRKPGWPAARVREATASESVFC